MLCRRICAVQAEAIVHAWRGPEFHCSGDECRRDGLEEGLQGAVQMCDLEMMYSRCRDCGELKNCQSDGDEWQSRE